MRVMSVTILFVICCALATAEEPIRHTLQVTLDPNLSSIHVVDRMTLPRDIDLSRTTFQLHGQLQLESNTNLIRTGSDTTQAGVPLQSFQLSHTDPDGTVTVSYAGALHHQLAGPQEESERSFSETPGLISKEGVFLANSTLWYPHVPNRMLSFSLDVRLPAGWTAVSQGARVLNENSSSATRVTWEENQPQDDIYLVAAPFLEYSQKAGAQTAYAFMRKAEPTLASKYLDATGQYLEMYAKLLGPYPYAKFALVENFWETGYGMPSFTLLGPQVIRFPFILHSSYPHEILHNWWGNGVYVDYSRGNWAEGLTAYLADHLLREQQGSGPEYRRDVLQKYTDYVQAARDFPLRDFQSRHNSASESIGYGKALMLFHMLRLQLGDDVFVNVLRGFYKKHQFKKASWEDFSRGVNESSGKDYGPFFQQWLEQTGAPQLELHHAENVGTQGKYATRFELAQTQAEKPFVINVPIALSIAGKPPLLTSISLTERQKTYIIDTPTPASHIQIDPQFDLFRRLDAREIPAALSQGFGSDRVVLIIPSAAAPELRQSYENLAVTWQSTQQGQIRIARDDEFTALPTQETVWVFGWENKWRDTLARALTETGAALQDATTTLDGSTLRRDTHAIVVATRNPQNPKQTWLWIGADNPRAHAGLARKLPHYRKYSYLAFTGDEPTNMLKGQWSTSHSPLVATLTGKNAIAAEKITPRPALAQLPARFSVDRMKADVSYLSASEREGRGVGSAGIDAAADYIAAALLAAGVQPAGDQAGSFFQEWEETFPPPIKKARLRNVIGLLPGTNPAFSGQSVIVSAHYDHLGFGQLNAHSGDEGKLHPGADDNASGVAVILELARAIGRSWQPERSIVFAAFTGEELGRRGSIHYVQHTSSLPTEKIIGVLNLDTVGRLGTAPLTVLGGGSAKEWIHIFRGVGFVTGLSTNVVAQDIGSSDQASFIERGVPAVQLFATAHTDFHRPTDTPDKIDYAGLVSVATIVKESLEYLSQRPEKLAFTGHGMEPIQKEMDHTTKRTGIGTVPDFSFPGPGVRVSEIVPGSTAEQVGLKKNDILVKLGEHDIRDLAHYSQLLRELKAGTSVLLSYTRDGKEHKVTVTLRSR